jgi:hypothetical protein
MNIYDQHDGELVALWKRTKGMNMTRPDDDGGVQAGRYARRAPCHGIHAARQKLAIRDFWSATHAGLDVLLGRERGQWAGSADGLKKR